MACELEPEIEFDKKHEKQVEDLAEQRGEFRLYDNLEDIVMQETEHFNEVGSDIQLDMLFAPTIGGNDLPIFWGPNRLNNNEAFPISHFKLRTGNEHNSKNLSNLITLPEYLENLNRYLDPRLSTVPINPDEAVIDNHQHVFLPIDRYDETGPLCDYKIRVLINNKKCLKKTLLVVTSDEGTSATLLTRNLQPLFLNMNRKRYSYTADGDFHLRIFEIPVINCGKLSEWPSNSTTPPCQVYVKPSKKIKTWHSRNADFDIYRDDSQPIKCTTIHYYLIDSATQLKEKLLLLY